jgi:hypothetical protein
MACALQWKCFAALAAAVDTGPLAQAPSAVAVLHEQGYLAEQQGDLDTARRLHLEALGDDALAQAATLEGLAAVAVADTDADGQPRLAATLLGAADAAREAAGAPLTGGAAFDIVRAGHQARTTLGAKLYTDAFAAGRGLTPARRWLSPVSPTRPDRAAAPSARG